MSDDRELRAAAETLFSSSTTGGAAHREMVEVFAGLATVVSGEYLVGREFLLVDIPLVGVSSAVGCAVGR